jgi:hypothetical protein
MNFFKKKLVNEQNPQISHGLHIRGFLVNMFLVSYEKFVIGRYKQLWQGP